MSQLWPMSNEGKYVEKLFRRSHILKQETSIHMCPFLTLDIDPVIPGTTTDILQPGKKSQLTSHRSGFWTSGIAMNQQRSQHGHTHLDSWLYEIRNVFLVKTFLARFPFTWDDIVLDLAKSVVYLGWILLYVLLYKSSLPSYIISFFRGEIL